MNAEIYKIISTTKNTMQVVSLMLVQLEFSSGKKQIRKVSITRHLRKVDDKWIGASTNPALRGKDRGFVDFTEAITKYHKRHEPQEQAA